MPIPFSPAWNFFRKMDLPVPSWRSTWRNSVTWGHPLKGFKSLVFLSRYGLVIRVSGRHRVIRQFNSHFVTSLFSRAAGVYQIDIVPGIESAMPKDGSPNFQTLLEQAADEGRAFRSALYKKYGIEDRDMKPANFGYVPMVMPRFPVLVDLDPNYIKFHRAQVFEPSVQDEFYAPLKDIMARAWPAHQRRPDPEGVKAFFEKCAAFKTQGKLRSDWERSDYFGTTDAGLNYERQLRRYEMDQSIRARLSAA